MKFFNFPAQSISTTGLATDTGQALTNTKLDTLHTDIGLTNTKLDTLNTATALQSIKQTTSLLDTSSTNIPASSGNPVTLLASTTAVTLSIQSIEDIGSYIGLYKGAASSETLVCALPLGGGDLKVNIPAGTRLSLRALENTAITSGKIILNLLG